jgi:branched-chain amino acid transport system substrate-binding protein
MKIKFIFAFLSLSMVIILLISGCGQKAQSPSAASSASNAQETGTINIGVACVLTGPAAFIGGHMSNAIMMAIDDYNARGGVTIQGKKYLLKGISRDTKGSAEAGKQVVEELIDVYNVKLIAGPFAMESSTIQPVIEEKKTITFMMAPDTPAQADISHLFSYFCMGAMEQPVAGLFTYLQKYYPDLKKVATLTDEYGAIPVSLEQTKKYSTEMGFTWLDADVFPMTTTDFMPIIKRVMAKNPEVIDTASALGDLGPQGILLIKQMREAGFTGPILVRANTDSKTLLEIAGKEAANKVIDIGVNPDGPVVPQSYREFVQRYTQKYNTFFVDITAPYYNATTAFLDYLNTQNTLDSTKLAQGFAEYKWSGIFGETFWGGKPVYQGNHICIRPLYISEWTDGVRNTKFAYSYPKEIAGSSY